MTLTLQASWTRVFAEALLGNACTVHGMDTTPVELPLAAWRAVADQSDRVVLNHCVGPTLDVGCGPGRMTQEFARRGQHALGIDVVPEAVAQARRRGIAALNLDVFGPIPGEGHWACVLLADGNIGIGGDPVRLLRRLHALLAPAGRVVLDLAAPGVGLRTRTVSLHCGGQVSEPFPWSLVGPESLRDVALMTGFVVVGLHAYDGRWFGVLEKLS